jgi:hypothetical protein
MMVMSLFGTSGHRIEASNTRKLSAPKKWAGWRIATSQPIFVMHCCISVGTESPLKSQAKLDLPWNVCLAAQRAKTRGVD